MRHFVATIFCCLTACSGSETNAPAQNNGGVDSGAETAPDADLAGFKCGAPPYYKWSGSVEAREPSGTKPAAGAKLTVEACPGETLSVGADGKFDLLLPRGAKTLGTIKLAGSLNTILGEWSVDSDQTNLALTLVPNVFAALIPEWDPSTEPAVVLRMETAPGASGACADVSGVSFVVKDQPAAVISYFNEGSIPSAVDGATATTSGGLVTFSNLTGDAVEIVGTKAGCDVSTKTRFQSGRIRLTPQYLNTMAAQIGN